MGGLVVSRSVSLLPGFLVGFRGFFNQACMDGVVSLLLVCSPFLPALRADETDVVSLIAPGVSVVLVVSIPQVEAVVGVVSEPWAAGPLPLAVGAVLRFLISLGGLDVSVSALWSAGPLPLTVGAVLHFLTALGGLVVSVSISFVVVSSILLSFHFLLLLFSFLKMSEGFKLLSLAGFLPLYHTGFSPSVPPTLSALPVGAAAPPSRFCWWSCCPSLSSPGWAALSPSSWGSCCSTIGSSPFTFFKVLSNLIISSFNSSFSTAHRQGVWAQCRQNPSPSQFSKTSFSAPAPLSGTFWVG